MARVVAALAALALAAPAAAFPPHRVVTVDPLRRTVDGLTLGAPGISFADRWGDPGLVAQLGGARSKGAMYSWQGPDRESAGVTFCDGPQRHAALISYSGAFVTTRGDRPGATLATFLRHWPGARVVGSRVRVGAVTFCLDAARRLTSTVQIGGAPLSLGGQLPAVC